MTLLELQRSLGLSAQQMRWHMYRVAKQIGQDAVLTAKAKFGEYQPSIEHFPAWDELADHTLYEKDRAGYAIPEPLLREGELRDSISFNAMQSSSKGVVIELYSTSEYAPVQELGGGRSNIPPRPFIGPVPFERMEIYQKMVADGMLTAVMPPGSAVFGTIFRIS